MPPSPPRRPAGSSGRRDGRPPRPPAQGRAQGRPERPGGQPSPPPPPPPRRRADPLLGRKIAGHEVLERVASGRLCTTYKANHAAMARLVAFKALSPQAGEADVARFYETAKFAAQLHHANIASIYDVSASGDLHFCTLEYVEGRSVGELLRARQKIASADAVRVAIDVAEALRFANAKGMPGWRLAPDHVVLTSRGEVKLLPPSFAPAGAPVLDDAYVLSAVGVLLYAMLTGGRVPDLEAALEPGSPVPRQLPRIKTAAMGTRQDIAQVVDRLLGHSDEPYASAEAGILGLRQLAATQDRLESRTRSATERARERVKRSRYGLYLGIGLAAIPVAVIAFLVFGRSSVQSNIEHQFNAANAAAQASIKDYNEARLRFFREPSEAAAQAAIGHLQKARAAYAGFLANSPSHLRATVAAQSLRTIDEAIAKFDAEARVQLRAAEGARRIKELDDTFDRETTARLDSGGQIDVEAWRKRYSPLLKEFGDSPKTVEMAAHALRVLPRRVERVQLKIDTNAAATEVTEKYLPKHQYGKALAAWDAYREKYDKIDALRKDALENYTAKADMIRREARVQNAQLTNQARYSAEKKDFARARQIYTQIIESFGIPEFVQRAKEELAKLPKE